MISKGNSICKKGKWLPEERYIAYCLRRAGQSYDSIRPILYDCMTDMGYTSSMRSLKAVKLGINAPRVQEAAHLRKLENL